MKNFGGFDCTGWYLDFMDEMQDFATRPTNVQTLKEMKSRFENAINQVDELVRLQQLGKNKQCSCWDGHNAIRYERVHTSFQPLKPKKIKKIKSKLKKARFKPAELRPVDGRAMRSQAFSVEVKLGDDVVFSRVVPEVGSPCGVATMDTQTNVRIKEILQSALGCVNTSLGIDGYTFKY
ncbi:hypothetical protein B9T36_07085 [Acinetobacter sp. ANC 4204]|uniref:hypothetical protein n=1 Tax=Acinetobacter sp. ANC 4204 TaxID=1977884 RepID=UPI000A33AA0C|nr:hypothetical protein [Acinetobacter sp. ANC 4204]OTG60378.1 hypothetical protein B9T36_07085 [Acinetobacter sp. ANC 4204]